MYEIQITSHKSCFTYWLLHLQRWRTLYHYKMELSWTVCSHLYRPCGLTVAGYTLKVEAARCSETLISYPNTWCHNPENLNLNLHCDENLIPHVSLYCSTYCVSHMACDNPSNISVYFSTNYNYITIRKFTVCLSPSFLPTVHYSHSLCFPQGHSATSSVEGCQRQGNHTIFFSSKQTQATSVPFSVNILCVTDWIITMIISYSKLWVTFSWCTMT